MFNLAKDGAVQQETHCVRDAQKNEINEKEESGLHANAPADGSRWRKYPSRIFSLPNK